MATVVFTTSASSATLWNDGATGIGRIRYRPRAFSRNVQPVGLPRVIGVGTKPMDGVGMALNPVILKYRLSSQSAVDSLRSTFQGFVTGALPGSLAIGSYGTETNCILVDFEFSDTNPVLSGGSTKFDVVVSLQFFKTRP